MEQSSAEHPLTYEPCSSQPTEQGGLGIRDMELINKSLIIHSAWNIATNKNPSYLIFLKLNTTLLIPSGMLLPRAPDPSIGLLLCKLNIT